MSQRTRVLDIDMERIEDIVGFRVGEGRRRFTGAWVGQTDCMATAVLDLDLEVLPAPVVGLERYEQALILIRWRRRSVGRITVPVIDGALQGLELQRAAVASLRWPFWEQWLRGHLGCEEGPPCPSALPATVAVCTRDRPEDLQRCLAGLMRLPDGDREILVVDNAPSSDAARRVVEGFGRARYVREDRRGLNVARNRALREARHEVVAFTDDDAVPDPDWLRALLRNFCDPLVLCATGLTMPLELETGAQEEFERYSPFGRGFRRVVFDGTTHDPLSVGRVGAGANMALRRSVMDLVGPFDEALDGGTPTRTGGDHEMFSRILAAGYRIVYDPTALSWHRHRRTWEELQQTIYGYGVGVYAMWTRGLLVEGEMAVLKRAWEWFIGSQLPSIIRSVLRRPNSKPLGLLLAELRGCTAGPRAYLISRQRIRGVAEP